MSAQLLLVAHGTRDPAGAVVTEAVAEQVRGLLGVRVAVCFVDVRHPTPAEALAELPGRCVAVPMFLAAGYHVRVDVPAQLPATGRADVLLAETFGPDPALVAAAVHRLRAAGARDGDAVVLAVVGSSDPYAQADGPTAARRLARELGRPVTLATIAMGELRVPDAVARLRADGPSAWPSRPGSWRRGCSSARWWRAGADVVAEPLATHEAVARLVAARYTAALANRAWARRRSRTRLSLARHREPSHVSLAAPRRAARRGRARAVGALVSGGGRVQDDALGAQARQLLGGDVRGAGAVRAQYAVPGQVVAVLGEDPADEAGAAGEPARAAISPYVDVSPGRDRPHGRAHRLHGRLVHQPRNSRTLAAVSAGCSR